MLTTKSQPAGYRFQTASYNTRQVIHVQKGVLLFIEDNKMQQLSAGWTVVLFPGTSFQLECRGQGYEGIGIVHASARLAPCDAGRSIVLPQDAGLTEVFNNVWQEVCAGVNRSDLALSAARFLEAAIHTRLLPLLAPRQPTLEDWLLRAAELLTQSTHERVSLRERMAVIPVSYTHLSRSFRRKWGIGLKPFFMRQKIAEARRLLEKEGASVTDIAYELGFSSSQHFATCFKAMTGRRPSEWAGLAGKARGRAAAGK